MLTSLLLLLPALAGRDLARVANDEVRDGVHGILLELDGDEAGALRRHQAQLDAANHRVYPVLVNEVGEVVYDGRRPDGAGASPNVSTTTPAIPADDGKHAFFVPYHRLQLGPGEHDVDLILRLDARLPDGPVDVMRSPDVRVRMPVLEWVFTAVEQPPGPSVGIPWRARLGQDVLVQGTREPAVVVLARGDALTLEVDVGGGVFLPPTAGTLERARRAHGVGSGPLRALEVRKAPPDVDGGEVKLLKTQLDGALGWRVDLRWHLTGQSVDALLPIQAVPYIADDDGRRWQLAAQPISAGADRARLFLPSWGLPSLVESEVPWRFGWDVVALAGPGSPLTRSIPLGHEEATVSLDGALRVVPLDAALVEASVADDRGLRLRAGVRWTLPEGLPGDDPPRTVAITLRWQGVDWAVEGPWTPCEGPVNDARGCAEAWTLRAPSHRSGLSRAELPLAWVAGVEDTPNVVVRAGAAGYRGALATLPLATPLPERHTVELRPRKALLDCADGSTVRLTWTAAGRELGSTTPRPCQGKVVFSPEDRIRVPAFAGDTLWLGVLVDGRTLRRVPVKVVPGQSRPVVAEATVGIQKAVIDVVIE